MSDTSYAQSLLGGNAKFRDTYNVGEPKEDLVLQEWDSPTPRSLVDYGFRTLSALRHSGVIANPRYGLFSPWQVRLSKSNYKQVKGSLVVMKLLLHIDGYINSIAQPILELGLIQHGLDKGAALMLLRASLRALVGFNPPRFRYRIPIKKEKTSRELTLEANLTLNRVLSKEPHLEGPKFMPHIRDINILDLYQIEDVSIEDTRSVRIYEANLVRKKLGYRPKPGGAPDEVHYNQLKSKVDICSFVKTNMLHDVASKLIEWRRTSYDLLVDGYPLEYPYELLARLERFESNLSKMVHGPSSEQVVTTCSNSEESELKAAVSNLDELDGFVQDKLFQAEATILSGNIPGKGATYRPPHKRTVSVSAKAPALSQKSKILGLGISIAKNADYVGNFIAYLREYKEYPQLDYHIVQGFYLRTSRTVSSILDDADWLTVSISQTESEQIRFIFQSLRKSVIRGITWTEAEEDLLQVFLSKTPQNEKFVNTITNLWNLARQRCETKGVPVPEFPFEQG